jgi:integrase
LRWASGKRHHIDESLFQRSLKTAVREAGLTKPLTSHTFRHLFATHLLSDGYGIGAVQELLGHKDVRTTMMYTHVLNRGGRLAGSPADGHVSNLRALLNVDRKMRHSRVVNESHRSREM